MMINGFLIYNPYMQIWGSIYATWYCLFWKEIIEDQLKLMRGGIPDDKVM
jgi:hypothetical protein